MYWITRARVCAPFLPPRRDDVYAAIIGAKRFILITGWSVWVETCLKRQPASEETVPKLGELLLRKAEEGVKVCLVVTCDWGVAGLSGAVDS